MNTDVGTDLIFALCDFFPSIYSVHLLGTLCCLMLVSIILLGRCCLVLVVVLHSLFFGYRSLRWIMLLLLLPLAFALLLLCQRLSGLIASRARGTLLMMPVVVDKIIGFPHYACSRKMTSIYHYTWRMFSTDSLFITNCVILMFQFSWEFLLDHDELVASCCRSHKSDLWTK
jgi:hypothetical protein